MQNNTNITKTQENEIDLKELFKTLWDKRIFILSFTLIITILSIVYVLLKNPIPLYKGKVMIEIGEGKNINTNIEYLDNVNNLNNIVTKKFKVRIHIPSKTTNIVVISSFDENKENIKNNINNAFNFILNRHKEKIKFYEKYIMTKKISDIEISNTPVNIPKKKLIVIVTFVTGFILSIFLVFFMNFIKSFKEEKPK